MTGAPPEAVRPPFARLIDRLSDRLRLPRRLRFTREGWYYFFFTLGVGSAALNTGNNLLFLVLGLQLTAIVVSGILSEVTLKSLRIVRELPSDPPAGDLFLVRYLVHNQKQVWPSLALFLAEKDGPFRGTRAALLSVPPGGVASASMEVRVHRRGHYTLSRVTVATRFPFGLFEKSRDLVIAGELFVLPVRRLSRERGEQGGGIEGERPEGRPGGGAEFLGLRELRAGDDRRFVHWRKSASAGRLLVVERERERHRRVMLLLGTRGPRGTDWLEAPVEQAAATARLLIRRGVEVGLSTGATYLRPSSGPNALRRLLRTLAVVEPDPAAPAPDARGEGSIRFGREGHGAPFFENQAGPGGSRTDRAPEPSR
jgi:uncharacterized protein (DUF58 family)